MTDIAVKLATIAGERLVEELSLLAGVRGEILYVINELEMLRSFLKEAEEKQWGDQVVRSWVKQVRRLAYDAEDCLDEFTFHLQQDSRRNQLARRLCGSLTSRHRIATEIQRIKQSIEEVSNKRTRYGIVTNVASNIIVYHANTDVQRYGPRQSSPQLVGIDGPRNKLLEWISSDSEHQLSLIAVVGEGGLGKTTIVRKAYDSPTVTGGSFKCRAWVTVSQTYNVEGIVKEIMKQVGVPLDSKETVHSMMDLIPKLIGYLEDKRYLIVFDDVWNIDAWKSVETALPKNEFGSRILLTTRNLELAEAAHATQIHGHIYHHKKLTSEQSMELFLRRVFINKAEQITCPEELIDVTRVILEKCDGLPLAIILIAGVLASKPNKSKQEWEKMMRHLGSELEHNRNLEGMKPILTLSYNDLPYNVRHCLLYLCKFPEDHLIKRKRVQRLWVAEGFVPSRHDMSAEEVAESYFNELANRFMILPSAFDLNGKVKSFRIHDIMLELILSKAREENFLSILSNSNSLITQDQDIIRRLSVHATYQPCVEQNISLSHVRSLTMMGHEPEDPDSLCGILWDLTMMMMDCGGMTMHIDFPSCRMLRVLDLEGCETLRSKHIKTVSNLIHLKYLSLRGTLVRKLPECLSRLKKLQTLDLRETLIRKLPNGIIKLQQLMFLAWHVPMEVPRGMWRLRALQGISSIHAKKSGKQVIKELAKMTQLRKLKLGYLPEDWVKDFCDYSLTAMSISLRSLAVGVKEGGASLRCLSELSKPPLLLETLTLAGKLGHLPPWILSLTNLLELQLQHSELREDAIQSLGVLPNLTRLVLVGRVIQGAESLCFGAQGFPRLKMLLIQWPPADLRAITFQVGAMRRLESVRVDSYHEEEMISIIGLTNLASLKELKTNIQLDEQAKAQLLQHPNHPAYSHSMFDL